MSTGVATRDKKKKKKIPYTIDYEGKQSSNYILSQKYSVFSQYKTFNNGDLNHLFFGDNLDVLLYLLNTGYKNKINLIYIDPPFATTFDFINKNQEYAYSDILCGAEYIEFLRERLIIMYELLSDKGSIYLHLDGNMAFAMKIIMDEIFGEKNSRGFITRKKCSTKNYTKNTFGNISDYILFYSKTKDYIWNRPYEEWDEEKIIKEYPCIDEKNGKRYKKVPIHAPGTRNGSSGKEWHGMLPPKGKHWQYTPEKLDELDKNGEIYWSPNGNPRRKIYCDYEKGIPFQDIWLNFRDSVNQNQKTTGYPTEKNIDMLKMIIESSSNNNDIVLDCFAGSGSFLEAAFELNRQWIGVDNSIESIKSIVTRFTVGLDLYGDYVNKKENKQPLLELFDKCQFDILSDNCRLQNLNKI